MSPDVAPAQDAYDSAAMQEQHDDKLLRSTRTFLARWQGVSGHVRPAGPSLRHLLIVLFRETDDSQNLTLAVDPLWWCGSFQWQETRLSIELVDAATSRAAGQEQQQRLFKITDASGDLECLTEWLEVKENVSL